MLPVKLNAPGETTTVCFLYITEVSATLTATSTASAPFGPTIAIANVNDEMPVPVNRIDPQPVFTVVTVAHSGELFATGILV